MKKLLFSSCIFFLSAMSVQAATKSGAPDFRYPETVINSATTQITSALQKGDGKNVVDGLVKLSLAKTKISADYMPEVIRKVDSIATTITDKPTKALLWSLEADMYHATYMRDQYKYDKRTEIAGEIPEDMEAWTGKNFRDTIISLYSKSLGYKEALLSSRTADYRKLLTEKSCDEFTPSLYDVIAYNAIKKVNQISEIKPIPLRTMTGFGRFLNMQIKTDDESRDFIETTLQSLLKANADKPAAFIYAEIQRLNYMKNNSTDGDEEMGRNKFAELIFDLYDRYAGSKYSTEALLELTGSIDMPYSRKVYDLAQRNIKQFGDYKRIAGLKNYVMRYEQKNVILTFEDVLVSGDSIEFGITARNTDRITVKAYKIPETLTMRSNVMEYIPKFSLVKTMSYNIDPKKENKVKFPALAYGKYLFIPEFTGKDGKKVVPEYIGQGSIARVTDLSVQRMTVNGEIRLYVLNAKNGKPIPKATLHIKRIDKISKMTTNNLGYAVVKDSNVSLNAYATYANDRSDDTNVYMYRNSSADRHDKQGDIFTDLAVYRPGDTVKFAAVIYDNYKNDNTVASNASVNVEIDDANGKEVAKMQLVTDKFGRVDSTIVVPNAGLTGRYSIQVSDASTNEYIAYHSFMVSEYKAPTFYIEYDKDKSTLAGNSKLNLKGKVMTYSQFPVENASVDYKISPQRGWFRFNENDDNGSDSGTVKTDKDGNWTIDIPDEIFGSDKSGYFLVELTATSESGESQTFNTNIGIGDKKYLSVDSDSQIIEAGKANRIGFKVTDVTGKEMATDCQYSLVSKSDTIASGTINSGNPVIGLSKFKSGSYDFVVSIPGEKDSKQKIDLQLYRKTDNMPPCDSPLWVAENSYKCDAAGNYSIRFGNSTPAYVYTIVYNSDGVIKEEFKKYDKGMHSIEGVAKFAKYGDTNIELVTVKNHDSMREMIRLIPSEPKDSLKIVAESFRDNITPGSRETWKLRLTGNNVKHYTGAVIANMYDAALNAIAPNPWKIYIPVETSYPYYFDDRYTYSQQAAASSTINLLTLPSYAIPYINMYGQSFYSIRLRGMGRYYTKSNAVYVTGSIEEVKRDEAAFNKATDDMAAPELKESMAVVSTTTDSSNNANLRDPDVKTAFFMPALVSDANGVVTIEFEAPNRNTQWAFTALAYTDDMKTDVLNKLVTSNKPIMVQPNLPRFIRTGDNAVLKAMVMNNSKQQADTRVKVELFDPETGKVISSNEKQMAIGANSSEVIATELAANADLQYIGYRITAATDEYSDGEQSVIAVLPSTTDVVEANPFYLDEKQKSKKLKLPKFDKGGKATLEYCDNPVWYCATALPSIISDSQTATAFIGNYYTTTVAGKIVADVPSVAEAIKYWNEKKSLKSNLQKNADLKTIGIENTPWISEAEGETAMMEKLIDLTDPATIQYRQQKALTSLSELQNADGGFSWIKGDHMSSEYLTWKILSHFGNLKESGYFDNGDALAKSMVEKAIAYSDREMLDEINKAKDPKSVYPRYFRYIFIRSMHKDAAPENKEVDKVANAAIAEAKANWGKYQIGDKAEIAIMLANYGETDDAAAIVESLRQHARKSQERGYYWDVDNTDKVALASTALRAFSKVNPADKDIDNIRRWILLSKETLKWDATPAALDAINAVLATGTSWNNSERKAPEITVAGKKIDTKSDDKYFGYIKRTIDMVSASKGVVEITRHGYNPAWGAVYYQYNAHMKEVAKTSSSDVKIEKKFYRYDNDGKLESVASSQFKVGDRLQVRLTVRTERDLDFVALTDQRPALFEPVDQLPVYEWKEGAVYLRETRDSATNIFFSRLNKGTRVITYDVFVNNAGTFSSGIATLQCQYAPQITAHSAGQEISAE